MRSLLLVLAALLAVGCGPKCPEPYYGGEGTDEVWAVLDDAKGRATVDDMRAAQLKSPASGSTVSTAKKATFSWTSSLSAQHHVPLHAIRNTPVLAGVGSSFGQWLLDSIAGHLPAVTGTVHWLRFDTGKACPAVELVTTASVWEPEDAAWEQLKGAGSAKVTVNVISAYVTSNRITEGPFKPSTPATFTLAP